MEQQRGLASKIVTYSTIAVAVAVIAAGLRHAPAGALGGTWRWYALPVVVAIGLHVVLLQRILWRRPSNRGIMYWFVLFLMASVFLLVTILGQALAATPEGAAYWQGLMPIAGICLVVNLTFFVLSYLQDVDFPPLPGSWSLVVLSGVGLMVITSLTNLVETHVPANPSLELWGYQSEPGPYTPIVFAWYGVLAVTILVMLVRAYHSATNPTRRRQLRLFMLGIGQYCAIAIVNDVVLYALFPHNTIPLSFLYTTVLSVMIGYGITRYDVLRMSPAALAGPILENLSEAVIGVDNAWRIAFANKGAEVMIGMPEVRLKGTLAKDLFSQSDFAQLTARIADRAGSCTLENLSLIHTANQKAVPITLAVSQVYDNRNDAAGYILVAQNVSALKRKTVELAQQKDTVEQQVVQRTAELHREQARLRASIENISLGFLMLGQDGAVIMQNKALQHIFDADQAFAALDDVGALLQNYDVVMQSNHVLRTGRPSQAHQITAGKKVLQIFMSPILATDHHMSKPSGVVILIEDITERTVLERSRDEFFSIASHELRTPLTAIRGNASMALQYYRHVQNDPGLQELMHDIHDSSVQLIAIVNDFLDTSRLEQGSMTLEPAECDVESVIRAVVKDLQPQADDKNLAVEVDGQTMTGLPVLWLDPERVRQIIYNLVGNAITYTSQGSVRISAGADAGLLHVFVADTGDGISLANQRLLFHKFQQASQSILTRNTSKGTGLGLYISRLLAEKMGGELVLVQSTEGKGSTFMLSLPITAPGDVHGPGKARQRVDTATGLTLSD